jgi:hypothetical protein
MVQLVALLQRATPLPVDTTLIRGQEQSNPTTSILSLPGRVAFIVNKIRAGMADNQTAVLQPYTR